MAAVIRFNCKTIRSWLDMGEGGLARATHLRCPTCKASMRCLYIAQAVMIIQCATCYLAEGIDVYAQDVPPTLAAIRKAKTRLRKLAPLSGLDLGPAPEG